MSDEFCGFVQRLDAGEAVRKWTSEDKAKFCHYHLVVQ